MNKQKLIGTIIGVIFFAALIAGATFAWLTFNATVTNGTYNGTSLNFTYTYEGGNAVNAISILGATPARNSITVENVNSTTINHGYIVLTASKATNTAGASSFNIKLHKTSSSISPESVIRYAVCKGTEDDANCKNSVSTAIPSTTNTTFVAYGQLGTWDSNTDITLYSDTSTFANEGAASATYYVYLWIDGTLVTSTNQSSIIGQSFSGYIHASSTQA